MIKTLFISGNYDLSHCEKPNCFEVKVKRL